MKFLITNTGYYASHASCDIRINIKYRTIREISTETYIQLSEDDFITELNKYTDFHISIEFYHYLRNLPSFICYLDELPLYYIAYKNHVSEQLNNIQKSEIHRCIDSFDYFMRRYATVSVPTPQEFINIMNPI